MGFIKTLENIYLSVPTFIICLYQVLYLHKILNDEKPSNHLEKIYFPMAIISIIICCIMIITLTYIIISDDSLSKIESIPLTILGSITLILTLYNLIMTKNKKKTYTQCNNNKSSYPLFNISMFRVYYYL